MKVVVWKQNFIVELCSSISGEEHVGTQQDVAGIIILFNLLKQRRAKVMLTSF